MIFSRRFEEYRKTRKLSYRSIGEAFGKTEGAIRMASKRHAIDEGFLRTLSENFDINLHWALTGKGEMINSGFRAAKEANEKTIDALIDEKVEEKIGVLKEDIMLLKIRNIILKELSDK